MATTDLHHSQHHAPGASSHPAVGAEKLPGIRHIVAVGSCQSVTRPYFPSTSESAKTSWGSATDGIAAAGNRQLRAR